MKNLKKMYVMLMLLQCIATTLSASYDEQSDISLIKQAMYDMRGLQDGFKIIGKDFETFVDSYIAASIPDKNDINLATTIELLGDFQEKANDLIIEKITPMVIKEIKLALETNEDLQIDKPQKFATKHPVLHYALKYKDSLTREIFQDRIDWDTINWRPGKITKSEMNAQESDTFGWSSHPNSANTFLIKACTKHNISVVTFLLVAGVDVNAKNKHDETPLHVATQQRSSEIAQVLINHGADVNAKNIHGMTPLHLAAVYNSTETAQILIDNGADIYAKNISLKTPFDLVQSPEMRELLLARQQEMNAPRSKISRY